MEREPSYHWSVVNLFEEVPQKLPLISDFGGGRIHSNFYQHRGNERFDLPHYLFQFTLKGQAEFTIGGETRLVGPGEGFLCNTHQADLHYGYPLGADSDYEFVYWCFHGADEMLAELLQWQGPIFTLSTDAVSLTTIQQFAVKQNITRRKSIAFNESTRMALYLINDLVQSLVVTSRKHTLVSRCRELIDQDPLTRHTVEELAHRLGVTRVYLTRLFRAETGLSPKKYIDKVRMDHAALLLKTTTQSIRELSERLGYDNPGHFIRNFKKIRGLTPGEYRLY